MATETGSSKIRVLMLDDHTIFRQGVARLLNTEPDLELKLHVGSVGEALLVLAVGLADLVLLDLDLGPERGIDFLAQARQNGFKGPVLILTAAVPEGQEELLRAHGISGILRKDASVDMLASRIREASGNPEPQWQDRSPHAGAGTRPYGLFRPFTQRESTVLRLIVEGLANKEIAGDLGCTESVVKAVVQQLFRKTGTHMRSQLVRVALERHRDQL